MNNHQNAIFHQLDNFMKHSHSFAMTIFHKITKSAKLVILLIIPTYAKVSHYQNINGVHYLLTKLGLSWISARSKHPKQDKEAQALYKKLQTKGNRCLACGHRLK